MLLWLQASKITFKIQCGEKVCCAYPRFPVLRVTVGVPSSLLPWALRFLLRSVHVGASRFSFTPEGCVTGLGSACQFSLPDTGKAVPLPPVPVVSGVESLASGRRNVISLVAYEVLLSSDVTSFTMPCPGVDFFRFIRPDVCSPSSFCRLTSFAKFGGFSGLFLRLLFQPGQLLPLLGLQ